MKESIESNQVFIRWQERLLEQRATLNNLLLGIGFAALGYQINLVFSRDKFSFFWWEQFYYESSSATIALSVIFGLCMCYTRLIDYTLTTKLARIKSQNVTTGLNKVRKKSIIYGKLTRWFFGLQTFSLTIGIMLLTAFYVVRYANVYY